MKARTKKAIELTTAVIAMLSLLATLTAIILIDLDILKKSETVATIVCIAIGMFSVVPLAVATALSEVKIID